MATGSQEETSCDVCESENEEEQEFGDRPTDPEPVEELMPAEELEGIEIPNQDQESPVSSPTVATGTVDPARAGARAEAADINVLLKWLGTHIDFKDFITLLPDETGKWKTRTQAGYEVHSFEQDKEVFHYLVDAK